MKTKKSNLDNVKEIEARRPNVLTKEYSEEYLKAIYWLLMNPITKEEAEEYYNTPEGIESEYQKKYKNVERYIETHF